MKDTTYSQAMFREGLLVLKKNCFMKPKGFVYSENIDIQVKSGLIYKEQVFSKLDPAFDWFIEERAKKGER